MTESAQAAAPVFEQVLYEMAAPKVARITLNRPELRNAQGLQMTYDLNDAFDVAAQDDDVSVIILAAAGTDFSSGHDLSGTETKPLGAYDRVGTWGQFRAPGLEGQYGREKEIYLEITERWRNLPKPVIAQVQGRVIAGGLMLAWLADLIIASDDAKFMDNTPDMGINGVEWFMHPYEVGVRKAKEWMFLADWMSAEDAARAGMVNRVVPRSELEATTLEIAKRIADKPRFTLKAIKESINNAQDLMGRRENMKFTFALHHLLHSHFMHTEGFAIHIGKLNPRVQERLRAQQSARPKAPVTED
jgi:enoyl-CoA hydratase